MEAKHAFMKGRFGYGIFYRSEDFLVFITIVSVRDEGRTQEGGLFLLKEYVFDL